MNWDNLIIEKFTKYSSFGYNYCDVGACKGYFTTFFKQLSGSRGKVFSFEINPTNYSDILYLQDENCIIEHKAVSNKNDKVTVYGTIGQDYQSGIVGHDVGYNKQEVICELESISLDSYFKNINLDFIKIDVEGAELQVIEGGIETLKKCKLAIIECHFEEDWEDIYNLLQKNGLKFKNIINDQDVFFGETTPQPGLSSIGRPYQMYLLN
jgi:FkbM family methyltransferase